MQGSKVGAYEVHELIGEGETGSVYKGIERDSGRPVAIKRIHERIDSASEVFLRFRRDADLLARFKHPNIARFIEFVEREEYLHIVTELVQGTDLRTRIGAGQPQVDAGTGFMVPLDTEIRLMAQVARALDYAHTYGVLHRGIKPSNILVSDAEEPDSVRAVDFATAHFNDYSRILSTTADGNGQSLAYMAPEQSGILRRTIDTRSDLYSLGIVFYELLTGIKPFRANDPGELMHQHIARIPDAPDQLVERIPPVVSRIILRLMNKDPDERYQSAYGVAEDLETYLQADVERKQTSFLTLGKKDRLKNLSYRTQLVGRRRERKRLRRHLHELWSGRGYITALAGKSGIGKTRLLSELPRYASGVTTFIVETAGSQRATTRPYYPFLDAAERLLQLIDRMPEAARNETRNRIARSLGTDGRILSGNIPGMAAVFGHDDETADAGGETERFFNALKDFFLTIATPDHPLVLSFDDAQLWDRDSVTFLDFLRQFMADKSLYIALTLREDAGGAAVPLMDTLRNAAGDGIGEILALGPLERDEVHQLVTEIFGTLEHGLRALSNRLYESSEGNPLLVIENIKTLVDRDIVSATAEGWSIDTSALEQFSFSSSIQEKLATRLERISKDTIEILRVAAVTGKEFTLQLLFAVLEKRETGVSREQLLRQLEEATEGLLLEQRISDRGDVVYSFVHDSVLVTLTENLEPSQLRSLHRQAAEAIEHEYHASDQVYRLAYHYVQAGSNRRGYLYSRKAAREALENHSYRLAVQFLEQALTILERSGKETATIMHTRIELALEIANLNFQLGVYGKAIDLLTSVIPLTVETEDTANRARILYLLAKNHFFSGDQATAMKYYYEVIPLAERLELPELLAIPYCAIGRAQVFLGYFTEAIDYLDRGLEILPESEVLEQIYSLGVLAQGYAYIGNAAKARDTLSALHQRYGDTTNEVFQLYIQFYSASVESLVGNPLKAVSAGEQSLELARDHKNIALELFSHYVIGLGRNALGNTGEAIEEISTALRIAGEYGVSLGMLTLCYTLAEIYAAVGNRDAALETLEKGRLHGEMYNANMAAQWEKRVRAIADTPFENPDYDSALAHIDKAITITHDLGDGYEFVLAQNRVIKGLILSASGRSEEGDSLYAEAVEEIRSLGAEIQVENAQHLRRMFSEPRASTEEVTEAEREPAVPETSSESASSYRRQLSYLLKLSEQLSRIVDMDELLSRIMSLAMEVSGAERGALFLFEDQRQGDRATSTLEMKTGHSVEGEQNEAEFVYSRTIVEQTVSMKEGQRIADAETERAQDDAVIEAGLKSIVTAPVMLSGRVIGAIYLDNRQVKGLFTEESFELLKAFAVEAAISIENARLYSQVRESARVEQEMQIATDIQTSILPAVSDTDSYEIGAFMRTATEVGGDYYDFDLAAEPYFGVFGDVSGHGLKSGLIMMMSEVAFHTIMADPDSKHKPLPDLYQSINRVLYENIQGRLSRRSNVGSQYSHMYMTFRLLRFDGKGHFEMFGNDHADPFICRAETGEIISIESRGFLMGILEEAVQGDESHTFTLDPDDLLVLYSDGITEARSYANDADRNQWEMYGEERLHALVSEERHRHPEAIIGSVMESVDSFMTGQDDDITMAVLKRKG